MSLQLFSRIGATVGMPEILMRTRAKAAAGGEHNRDEKGITLIVLSNSGDSEVNRPAIEVGISKVPEKALINKIKGARTTRRGKG